MSDKPCYYIKDSIAGRVLIPGCYGGVFNGMAGCICERPSKTEQIKRLGSVVVKLELRIHELEQRLQDFPVCKCASAGGLATDLPKRLHEDRRCKPAM